MATTATGGSLTAASPLLAFQTLDAGIVGVEVSGTWTGTITFEARIGNTWANAQVFTVASVVVAATTTANVSRLINAGGFSEVRANFSTPTSGTPVIIFTGSPESMGGSGGGGGGGGGAVTVGDGADVAEGTTTDAGVVTDTSGTLIGFARGNIIKWIAQALLLGAVNEAAPASDTASSGLNGRLQRIAQRITSMIALLPASLGGKAAASSLAVTLATDEPLVGILTEAAPASDTASSGLNGRLQRIAQRLTTLMTTNLLTQGDVAHDGVDSGNPAKIGMRALAHGTNPTAVAAADRTDWLANRAGVPWVIGGHPNVQTIRATYTSAQTDTALVTVAAGLKIVCTRITFACDKANTVNVSARAGFGTANTPTTTGVLASHPGIDPGGGMNVGNGAGIIGVGADDADLRVTTSAATTGSIEVVASFYTIES
jgi:hypothetical protein